MGQHRPSGAGLEGTDTPRDGHPTTRGHASHAFGGYRRARAAAVAGCRACAGRRALDGARARSGKRLTPEPVSACAPTRGVAPSAVLEPSAVPAGRPPEAPRPGPGGHAVGDRWSAPTRGAIPVAGRLGRTRARRGRQVRGRDDPGERSSPPGATQGVEGPSLPVTIGSATSGDGGPQAAGDGPSSSRRADPGLRARLALRRACRTRP